MTKYNCITEIIAFYAKYCQATSTYIALHNPWSQFISSLWWVSLAEYLLVLRVLFPLLQMAYYIMDIARVASIPPWMRSKPWAGFLINPYLCFCGPWSYLALYHTMLETLLSNLICFRFYLSNSDYNNSISYSDDGNVSANFM